MEFIERYSYNVNGRMLLIEKIHANKILITDPTGLVLEFGNEKDAVAFIKNEISISKSFVKEN